jgi:anthranilate/para-aminobenzoate synthase component I
VKKGIACRLKIERVCADICLEAVTRQFSQLNNSAILGGNFAESEHVRYSYWMAEPVEVFEVDNYRSETLEMLDRVLGKYRLAKSDEDIPGDFFSCGWVGYFAYELGSYLENIALKIDKDVPVDLIRLCFYDRFIAYDHENKQWLLCAIDIKGKSEAAEEKIEGLHHLLLECKSEQAVTMPAEIETQSDEAVQANMSRGYYFESLEKIKKLIYDGEVYQVNFSQRFSADFTGEAAELFLWQNEHNACAFSAYIDAGDYKIVSSSPELFFRICGDRIITEPIKGTRPRFINDDEANARSIAELTESEKERAELDMIIDLERNDLGRICRAGTIKVEQRRKITAHPTLYHASAVIAGELKGGVTFSEILRGMFAGGSITGAPKISSMKIISELEPTARGVYTGSIGYIGIDGNVCLNIAIRTIIICRDKAYFQAGGGIVADSVAEAEWDEMMCKSGALAAGIRAVNRPKD